MRTRPHIPEDLRHPQDHGGVNGNGVVHHGVLENNRDNRMIYFVIGGIVLAFGVGLGFLIFAMTLDWQ